MTIDPANEPDEVEVAPQAPQVPGVRQPGSPPGTPHARAAGVAAFGMGVVLMVVTFFTLLAAFASESWLLSGAGAVKPATAYSSWLIHQLLFILPFLLLTMVGWAVAGQGARMHSAGCIVRPSQLGKSVGLLVFCGGIGLVVLVFLTASHYFSTTPGQVPAPPADDIAWALGGILRLAMLAILALDGSLIAGRGVQFFLGSFSTGEKYQV